MTKCSTMLHKACCSFKPIAGAWHVKSVIVYRLFIWTRQATFKEMF